MKLLENETYFTGVVRKDRNGVPQLKADNKMIRGEYDMKFCKDANIMAVKWIDNKAVHVISTRINAEILTAERRIKGDANKIKVFCPAIIKDYNKHMGGVDLNDRLKITHELDRRGTRYYLRIAFDMFDQAIVNSRIVFNTINPENKLNGKEYRLKVSEGIVKGYCIRKRNPTNNEISTGFKTCNIGGNHLPIFTERKRCYVCFKIFRKDVKSFIQCSACSVSLCLNKDRNCFKDYHQ